MSEPVTHPGLNLEAMLPPPSKWGRERRAFLRLLPELRKSHFGKYVAIHEEQVVDSDEDELALASRVWQRHGYVPLHIERVADQPAPPVRIPHYRELKQG
jgi:hypothetical protein